MGKPPRFRPPSFSSRGSQERAITRLRRLALEAITLAEEANGDPSSCSYNVPIGDRLKDLRKEVRGG